MNKLVLLIIVTTNYLAAQGTNIIALELTYEILDIESIPDTILTKEIKYDSAGMKVMQTIFREHLFENYYNDVVEYQYLAESTKEVNMMLFVKIATTKLLGRMKLCCTQKMEIHHMY